jgi:glutathione S-transferase
MINLYQFKRYWGLPNPSPFCMKLETYLRLAKLPYKINVIQNPGNAPKGKLPFIKDEGVTLSDTSMIIEYLKKKYGDPLDEHLTSMQKAQGIAVQRMLEEHLYWIMVYSRWIEPEGWKVISKDFFSDMPRIIRAFVPNMLRRSVKKTLYRQGIGRHSREEIYMLGKQDLTSIADLLYSQPFLFGNKPTSFDACAYAFLASILMSPVNSPLKAYASLRPELAAYCDRMKQIAYPLGASEEKDFYYQGA